MPSRRDKAEAKRILQEAGWSTEQIEGVLKPDAPEEAGHVWKDRETGLRRLINNLLKVGEEDKAFDTTSGVQKMWQKWLEGDQSQRYSLDVQYYPSHVSRSAAKDIENLLSSIKVIDSGSFVEQIDQLCSSPKMRSLIRDKIQRNYIAIVISIDQKYKTTLKYKDLEIRSCYREIDELKDVLQSFYMRRAAAKEKGKSAE